MVSKTDPRYGRGVVTIEDWVDGDEVLEELRSVFRAPDYAPPQLPQVAVELLGLSQSPDVSFGQVSKLLERDAMLCGQVLRVAQSPVYAGRARITSIPQALSRLGLSSLRDIVLQVALNGRVFRAKPYQPTMERLRLHSTVVAHASRIVCRYTSLETEYAFLCGLLHDVGKAGALIALAERNRKNPPGLDDAWPAIIGVHAEASQCMVEQWGLPAEVSMVVGAHHIVRIQGYPHPLAAAVNLADRLAAELGFSTSGSAPVTGRFGVMPVPEVLEILGLSEQQLGQIRDDVKTAIDTAV